MENLKWKVIITHLRCTVTVKRRTKPRALDCQTYISITILKHLSNTCTAHLKTREGRKKKAKNKQREECEHFPCGVRWQGGESSCSEVFRNSTK